MRTILPLTSLRAFFAFWVLTRHWFYVYPAPGGPYFDLGASFRLFGSGYLGVDGFFILSGFILSYNYARSTSPRMDYLNFLKNRIARIYPVHLACLIMVGLLIIARQAILHKTIIGTEGNTIENLFLNILLLNSWNFSSQTGWNDVAWSVSAEWFAYVFFPLFLVVANTRRPLHLAIIIFTAILMLAIVEHSGGIDRLSIPGGLIRLIPEFCIGVAILRIWEITPSWRHFRFGSLIAISITAIGVTAELDTLSVAGLAILIFFLAADDDLLAPVMSIRPLIYLGEISYCLYMVQRLPQYLWSFARKKSEFIAALPVPVSAATLALLCVACAAALHHLVERPGRNLIKQFAGRKEASKATTPSSP